MISPRELEQRWKTWLAERNRRGMVTVFWIVLALYPAFGILLSPMIAGVAMSLSSVSVIANALRLRALKL